MVAPLGLPEQPAASQFDRSYRHFELFFPSPGNISGSSSGQGQEAGVVLFELGADPDHRHIYVNTFNI